LDGGFDEEFDDVGVSGAVLDAKHLDFASLLVFIRRGDTLHAYALDRLGRDALDVQFTVLPLLGKDVAVHVQGPGVMATGAGELTLAVLDR
jgi:putative DNA-invertase from lambdoid prophage Rac